MSMTRRGILLFAVALCAVWSGAVPAQGATPPAAKKAAPAADDSRDQPTLGDDKDVIAASERWLKLLDDGKLGPAWDSAAPLLKSAVTRVEWIEGIGAARKPFGQVKSRASDRFARSHEMPGGPQGDYAIVAFQTVFANGKHAEEQLTWQLGDNDTWRVSGYYIR
jgi:Protein of unknown function (DUF4019)